MAARILLNSDELRASNSLIGLYAMDTLDQVGDVLEFLREFHLRESPNSTSEAVENGMVYVLSLAVSALRRQAAALENCRKGADHA